MNLGRLAWKNIHGSAFRSAVVALCAVLVAGFALSATVIIRGAEESLQLAIERLGADIIVVPEGAETKVEGALLMGHPTSVWMPEENVKRIAAIEGVDVASPQLYLSTLNGASCCSVSNMFLIAYDPASDFTIQPWLKNKIGCSLRLGESVGGTYIFTPPGEQNIKLYGYFLTLKANLEPTGTGLDQSMFLTFDTARDVARISRTQAVKSLNIPPHSVSAAMVKVLPGSNPHAVALQIMQRIPGVTPIESPDLFQSYRKQMTGLLHSVVVILALVLVLSIALIGLVFSMAANERKRELGVLRALGATRRFIFLDLLTEASLLALSGGIAGIVFAGIGIYLFQKLIIVSLGIPFIFPSVSSLALITFSGIVLSLASVTMAALLPAFRISRQDPAVAMRE
jgi:putative ABC transport system permease protein